jgi:hypothetical protein
MQTYFEKLERCEYLPNSVTGHGFDGWLTTSLTSLALVVEDTKLISLVLSAATALGMVSLCISDEPECGSMLTQAAGTFDESPQYCDWPCPCSVRGHQLARADRHERIPGPHHGRPRSLHPQRPARLHNVDRQRRQRRRES